MKTRPLIDAAIFSIGSFEEKTRRLCWLMQALRSKGEVMLQVVLGLAFLLLVGWLIYIFVIWLWELTLAVFEWMAENWLLLLLVTLFFAWGMWSIGKKKEEHQRLREEEVRRERAEERRRIQMRRDKEAKRERERKEREAKVESERRLAEEKRKAERDAVQNVLKVCKADGLHPQFIAKLRPLLDSGPKTVRPNDVLKHVWIPLGKPKQGGAMEVWQEWAMEQLDVSSGWSGASSQLKKLKSKTVNPMKRDLGVLVDTAQSSARYGKLVRLWEKYEGSPRYKEVIERVYKGEREDYVLLDLDVFQG